MQKEEWKKKEADEGEGNKKMGFIKKDWGWE